MTNKLRQAAEMALEAFEDILSARSRGFGIDYVEGYAKTTLRQLRQALAEPETLAEIEKALIDAVERGEGFVKIQYVDPITKGDICGNG